MQGQFLIASFQRTIFVLLSCCLIYADEKIDIPGPEQRTLDFTYQLTAKALPGGDAEAMAWVPIPPSNKQQTVHSFQINSDYPYRIVTEPEYGNAFFMFDLSTARGDTTVSVTFRVTRNAFSVRNGDPGTETGPTEMKRFLVSDNLVPIVGKVMKEAKRVVGKSNGQLATSRRLYDHIVSSLSYDKSGKGWGLGDANYACDIRKGNCTDFHSLFIGEARSMKIPSRFVMGFPIPEDKEGTVGGYHCWAEFYVEDKGWMPIDASEASKHPEKKEAFFGGLDANRIQFTLGRDIQVPNSDVNPVNYFIYPHVELNGNKYEKVERLFSYKEIDKKS